MAASTAAAAGLSAAPVAPGAPFRQVSVAATTGIAAGTGFVAVFRRSRRGLVVIRHTFRTACDPEHCLVRGLQGHAVECRDTFAGKART